MSLVVSNVVELIVAESGISWSSALVTVVVPERLDEST
jgi:hypothetical protein